MTIPFQLFQKNIGEILNLTDEYPTKKPIMAAVEDATVIFLFTMVSSLVALGFPPTMSSVYVPLLSASLVGIVTYMRVRKITRDG